VIEKLREAWRKESIRKKERIALLEAMPHEVRRTLNTGAYFYILLGSSILAFEIANQIITNTYGQNDFTPAFCAGSFFATVGIASLFGMNLGYIAALRPDLLGIDAERDETATWAVCPSEMKNVAKVAPNKYVWNHKDKVKE
jgi:hypothetical protein